MNYVIVAERPWYWDMVSSLEACTGQSFHLIDSYKNLTVDKLASLNPRYVFIPHWSKRIPEAVFGQFECVIFHMTDLPFGRGGSPLQNLIVRGIYDTKISALRCVDEMDAGPVYLKRDLRLDGSAEEIFQRAAGIIKEMIEYLVRYEPEPVEQSGPAVHFTRRKPDDSNISDLKELGQVFDYIRMLDADGYPHAFLETRHLRFEFRGALNRDDHIEANVCITKKRE